MRRYDGTGLPLIPGSPSRLGHPDDGARITLGCKVQRRDAIPVLCVNAGLLTGVLTLSAQGVGKFTGGAAGLCTHQGLRNALKALSGGPM